MHVVQHLPLCLMRIACFALNFFVRVGVETCRHNYFNWVSNVRFLARVCKRKKLFVLVIRPAYVYAMRAAIFFQ